MMHRTTSGEVKASPFSLSAALTKDFISPDTILYHGTVGSFDKFDLKAPRNASTPTDEVNAVFFSTDKFKAYSHARRKAKVTGEPPVILQAKVNFKNLFDATEPVKKLQKKLKNFGQAKRQIYSSVDKTKYDGIEFRGDNVNDAEYCFWYPQQIRILNDKTMEAMIVERKYLTKDEMIKQGAGGHLSRAVKCLIPLDKLDGLEPVPSASEGNPYVKGKKITNPIEVQYNKLNDVYIVYAGNHRIEQARRNGDKYIPAFVEPDGGKLGIHIKPYNMEASEPYGYWYTSEGKAKPVKQEDHEAVVLDYLEQDNTRLSAYKEWQKETGYGSAVTYALYELGWIRVVTGKSLNVEICVQNVSMKAYVSMRRELPNLDFVNIVFDYSGGDQGTKHDTFDRNQLPAMFKIVRRNVNPDLDNNSMTASSEYGYWLHDGKIGEVEHQAHDIYIRKHFSDKKLGAEPWAHGFKQGWIRAVNERNGNLAIELWYDFVNRGALKALSELINKRNTYKGFIVEINRGTGNAVLPEHLRKRWFTFKEDEEKQVLHLVRQCLNSEITAMDEQYGYWFTDKGEKLDVEEMRHNYVARTYIEMDKEIEDRFNAFKSTDIYSDIYKNFALKELGWIRCTVTDAMLAIEIAPGKVAPKAFKALRQYVDKESLAEEFLLDVINTNSRFLNRDRKQALYNDIQKQVDKTMIANDDDEPYGYWITDDGQLLKVDYEDHNSVADKYIHRHFYKEYLEWVQENDTMDSTEFALTKGFVRLVAEGEVLNVEIDKSGIDPKAYKALSKFYTSTYFDRINVDVGFQRTTTTSKRFSAYEDNLNKFLPFIRTYVKKNSLQAYDDSEDTFECWITDKAIVPSPFSHVRTLNSIIAKKKQYTDLHQTRKAGTFQSNEDAYEYGTKLGWIRIVGKPFSPGVNIFGNSVNPNAYKMFSKYFNDRVEKDARVTIEIMQDDYKKSSYKEDTSIKVISIVRQNVRKDKTIVAIDEDNNVTGKYTQIAIEKWQPDGSSDQIQLLNIGQDFIIRNITQSETNDLVPFKFVETARKALLDRVKDMERAGVIYKKIGDLPLHAADDETVIKRWETTGGKHAITLVQDKYGYAINNFILLPNNEYKKDGTSYLGKADLEQALKKINEQLALYKNVDGSGFKEVRVSKVLENIVPKKQAEKAAQVTVRGKAQNPLDGFTKFSKQPDFPGLSVYLKKVGSFQYAKVVHDSSNLALISLTDKPLAFSPTELVERLNVSPLKTVNWLLGQDQLFKKYGPQVLTDMVSKFIASLSMKKQDKTDLELEAGLKTLVKDYIISLYLKRPAAAKNLQKQIDAVIQKKGLNKEKVYFYYGNPAIKSEETWTKVGLVRTGTSSPYKYEFADKVKPITEEPVKTVEPTPADKPKGGMVGAYVSGIDKFGNKITGILLTQKTNPRTHKTEGTAVILDDDVPIKAQLKEVRRKLVKPPADLLKAYKIISAKHRLESHDLIATGLSKEELKALNKRRPDPSRGHHSYRLKIGSYCEAKIKRKKQVGFGYGRKFVDHVDTVKGILVKENSYKNGGVASGGLLMLDKVDKETGKQNFVVNEVTGIQPIFRKPPTLLKDHYNKLAKAGKIPGGKEIK